MARWPGWVLPAPETMPAHWINDGGSCKNHWCSIYILLVGLFNSLLYGLWHSPAQVAVCAERHWTTDHHHHHHLILTHDITYKRSVTGTWRRYHITPVLRELHWLLSTCQVQSGISGSPVTVQAGASLLGRWLLSCVQQHSAISADRWHSNLCGAANTQQLRQQYFCSGWISLVELSSGPAA